MPPRLNRNVNSTSNSSADISSIVQDEHNSLSYDPIPRPTARQKQKSHRQLSEPQPIEIVLDRGESDSDPDSAFGTPRRVRGEPEAVILEAAPLSTGYGDRSRSPSVRPKLPPSKSASGLTVQRPISPGQSRSVPQSLEDDESSISAKPSTGHSRTPVLARDPSTLESLSKAVRSYLPSTTSFPASPFSASNASPQHRSLARSQRSPASSGSLRSLTPGSPSRVAPAPPLVSKPVVSFGRSPSPPVTSRVGGMFDLGDPVNQSFDEPDPILWSRFDDLEGQRYLLLGYAHGIQMWSCSNLGKLNEVLNIPDASVLSGAPSGDEYVKHAGFLPCISDEDAPLLGLILSSFFTIYSLPRSHVVRCMTECPGADRFEANANHILLSTVNPAHLHIISAKTFQTLHSISPKSLLTAIAPPYLITSSNNHDPALRYVPERSIFEAYLTQPSPSRPVFASSGRLLAYLSPPPPTVSPGDKAGKRRSGGAASIGGKLGGAMLSGMRFAFTAAAQASSAGAGGRYFSKSAPAGESNDGTWPSSSPTPLSPFTATHHPSSEGQYITIMDLKQMKKVSGFYVTPDVAALSFSKDGTNVVVSTKDGTTFAIFSLRSLQQPYREYDLRRGRTAAVADHSSIEWTADGLWLGASTRNRTLHIFPVNPYGGKVDTWSHVQGRVRNGADLVHKGDPNTVQVHPLARIRPVNKAPHEQLATPLAFTFLASTNTRFISPRSSISTQKDSSSKSHHRDVLVFDPMEGVLSLHRFFVDRKPARVTGNVTSASLPSNMLSNLSAMMEGSEQELVAKEATIASWPEVQRKKGWEGCDWISPMPKPKSRITTDWLSQAELTTSQHQRSVYLSHQLSFHALGEDYHALIRTRQFNIPATKIVVQREVHPVSSSENLSAGQIGHQVPLNEALSIGLDHTPPIATLPMYPNGTPRSWSRPSSMSLGSIPIKTVTEGVSEGFGRIRREINKARSPVSPVAKTEERLEFDEQDEDFELGHGQDQHSENATDEGEVFMLDHEPTPASALAASALAEDDSQGWEPAEEAQNVVDELERFDDITVVGFLEEEQEDIIRAEYEKRDAAMKQEEEQFEVPVKKGKKKKGRK